MTSLKIESTETGTILLLKRENSIQEVKQQISHLLSIPTTDQILLFGPPFKILDNQYSPHMEFIDKRIFIYDRRVLVDEGNEPPRVRLLPFDYSPPDSLTLTGSSLTEKIIHQLPQPLPPYLKKLLDYEVYFHQNLKR